MKTKQIREYFSEENLFLQGVQAFKDGLYFYDNPYTCIVDVDCWQAGYNHAQELVASEKYRKDNP